MPEVQNRQSTGVQFLPELRLPAADPFRKRSEVVVDHFCGYLRGWFYLLLLLSSLATRAPAGNADPDLTG